MMGTSHSTRRNTNILRREAGDKCCLETGKEDILQEKPEGKDTGLTRQGDWELRNQKSKLRQQLKEISSSETSSTGSGSVNHINVNTMLHDGLPFFHLSVFLIQLNYCSLTSYHRAAELHFHTQNKQSSQNPEDKLH